MNQLNAWKATSSGPCLFTARCTACDYVDLPAQAFGCRECGASGDSLTTVELPARGRVVSFAHVAAHGDVSEFLIELQLANGPLARVRLRHERPGAGLAVIGSVASDSAGERLVFIEESSHHVD